MGGGGGISGAQKNYGAGRLADIAKYGYDTSSNWSQQGLNTAGLVSPFYQKQMQQGLDFYPALTDYSRGLNAQAFGPQYGQIARQTQQFSNLPSGYRQGLFTNLGAQQARSFDNTMMQNLYANQMAKNQGAAGMTGQEQIANQNALGYLNTSAGAGQSLAYGQQRPSLVTTLLGAGQGAAQTGANIATMEAAG